MSKDIQRDILMSHGVDDKIIWTQNGKQWVGECYAIRPVTKHAEREDIFYKIPTPKHKRVKSVS